MTRNRSILSLSLPKATISSLTAAGYETVKDLANATVDGLVQDLKIPQEDAEQVIALRTSSATFPSTFAGTQSATSMAQVAEKVPTGLAVLDELLNGGLQRGHALELSGPPGLPKELVVMSVIGRWARQGHTVVVADCQNMMNRRILFDISKRASNRSRIQYSRPQTLAGLILFLEQLPTILGTSSKGALLVLSSISTLFQSIELNPSSKTALLQKVKQVLAQHTVANNLTVVITCQLATKFVNSDGSPGTYDSGAQGIMAPQLGSQYLPAGRSWRVIFSPDSRTTGYYQRLILTLALQRPKCTPFDVHLRPSELSFGYFHDSMRKEGDTTILHVL